MQILYVTAMIAVSVLCIALLSTARRILHASPLASGQLGIGHAQSFQVAMEPPSREWEADVLLDANSPATTPRFAEPAEEVAPEPVPSAAVPASASTTSFTAPVEPLPIPNSQKEPIDISVAPKSRIAKALKLRKPSRRTSAYALECALLGVSAWVLIRTQRELQKSSLPPSRDVA